MENAILAWEMNGEPIPLAQGGPLRVVIPGYYGINNVKYVKRVAFTESETEAVRSRGQSAAWNAHDRQQGHRLGG